VDGESAAPDRESVWRPGRPCPVGQLLGIHRRGSGDPTYRVDDRGRHWRGVRTPQGPATLVVEARPAEGAVNAAAWGPGADWAVGSVPALLGALDDPSGFEPRHPVLEEAVRRYPHFRIGRTGLMWESLMPAVVEQKVTGKEAFAGYRRVVHRFGDRAPGPGRGLRLWVQPSPETVAMIPSWSWLHAHVDPARSRTLVRAARVAGSLERVVDLPGDEAARRLRSLPGVGEWTAAEVRQRALGDPDAVSFGDYHVAKDVGWALTGRPFDDDELREHLEPWRPHRGRVPAYLALAGHHRPRRGPRIAPRTHLPVR
jgi:3-methyladenine DNA glycosylase/8-oxoguanine DNA glycosylase